MSASTCVSFFTWWISLIILFGFLEHGKKRKEIQSLRNYLPWLLFYLFLVGFDCINRHKFTIFYVKFNNKILCIWTHSSTSSCHTWNSITFFGYHVFKRNSSSTNLHFWGLRLSLALWKSAMKTQNNSYLLVKFWEAPAFMSCL